VHISFKFIISLFLFGIIVGLGISPWIDSRPYDKILTPVSDSYAFASGNSFSYTMNKKQSKQTMKKYFLAFEQEQKPPVIKKPKVLGEKTENTVSRSSKTGRKTIAILGDSMVDTMGTGLPYLDKALKAQFPKMEFNLLNYGIGSENIVSANSRIDGNYIYKDRSYPKLAEAGADIIIVESFAYNPLEDSDADLAKHREMLTSIIGKLRKDNTSIVFLATICPLKSNFGKGPGGVNWSSDIAWNHATKIQKFLENGISVAKDLGLPVIDAYHPTLLSSGEGIGKYVSTHDGIHPSVAGHQLVSSMIVNKLIGLGLL
jgi:lysophospholipase L1-like esterase